MQFTDGITGLRKYLLEYGPFPGVIVDNADPERRGRCRIRVWDIYGSDADSIPDNAIPWAEPHKDISGRSFSIPDLGKIAHVSFLQGDIVQPQYDMIEHYHPALQARLDDYADTVKDDVYRSFISLCHDAKLQIWSDSEIGLILDYNMTQINIDADSNIHVELKDPTKKLNTVHRDANQPFINGKNYAEFFDAFMQLYLTNQVSITTGPGAPSATTPAMMQLASRWFAIRDTKVLSWYFFNRDNIPWNPLYRIDANEGSDIKDPNDLNNLNF